MQRELREQAPRRAARSWALLLLLLAMGLPILAGCALFGAPAPQSAAPSAAAPEPGVAPLEDGRRGFIIREASSLDEAQRRQFARAVVLLQEGQSAQAADILEQVVAQQPEVTAPYINLAIARVRLEQPEAAEAHLQTALALVPGHPVAANIYGLLCRRQGRFQEARTLYEAALERFPDYYPVRRNLAILCDLYLNDLPSALVHYEIYSQARPEEQQVRFWIADLHNRMETREGGSAVAGRPLSKEQ